MPTYLFVFEAKPTSAAQQARDVQEALAHVFVVAPSLAEAETRAREHLMEYAWVVTAVQHALEPQPEQIARCDASVVALHQKALRDGVASDFIAWPKVEGKNDDQVELRLLGAPVLDNKRRH